MAEWSEADHPRDADGKFGAGGGTLVLDSSGPMGASITDGQINDVLGDYCLNGYFRINGGLRENLGRTSQMDVDVAASVATMDAAFKSDVAQPMGEFGTNTVYRGISERTVSVTGLAELSPGDQINDQGYMSTTYEARVASEFGNLGGAIMQINVPSDLNVLPGTFAEKEVILPRGSTLEYVGSRGILSDITSPDPYGVGDNAVVYEFNYVASGQSAFR